MMGRPLLSFIDFTISWGILMTREFPDFDTPPPPEPEEAALPDFCFNLFHRLLREVLRPALRAGLHLLHPEVYPEELHLRGALLELAAASASDPLDLCAHGAFTVTW